MSCANNIHEAFYRSIETTPTHRPSTTDSVAAISGAKEEFVAIAQ